MLPKTSVFIATSLDGFIARKDGNIDWLNEANSLLPPEEDCGYNDFISTIDTIVMGRNSFEKVLSFDQWYYGSMPVVVLSHSLKSLPDHVPDTVSISQEQPINLLERLSKLGRKHLYIDGGITIQGFLKAGLINEMTITIIPIILGDGKPLFGFLPSEIKVKHLGTKTFDCGFVQNKYLVLSNHH